MSEETLASINLQLIELVDEKNKRIVELERSLGLEKRYVELALRSQQIAIQEQVKRIAELEEKLEEAKHEKEFVYKCVERGLFQEGYGHEQALKNIFHFPSAPWNSKDWEWDVSHKSYAETFKQALKKEE